MPILRRRGWIVVACLLLMPAAVYVQTARQPKVYASSMILEGDAKPYVPVGGTTVVNPGDTTLALRYLATPAVPRETARVVAERFGATATVGATLDSDTGWLTLTATGPEPAATTATANVSASVLRRTLRGAFDEELDGAIAAAERSLRLLRDPELRTQASDELRALRAARRNRPETLRVVEPASQATVVAPNPWRNAALAVILALLVAPGLVLLAERYDRRIRRPGQLEALVDEPLLATIPADSFGSNPARADDAFARLRDGLRVRPGPPLRSIAVASPLGREGRTTIVAGLGFAFARAGHRVVVVDADLRGRALAPRLAAAPSTGLAGILAGAPLQEALRVVADRTAELHVLPAGAPVHHPDDLLGSEQMASVLRALTGEFDMVIIDTPPLLAVSDALAILQHVSGILCVARIDQTPRPAVSRMRELATAAGGRILGTVATSVRSPRRERRTREAPVELAAQPSSEASSRAAR